MSNLWLVDRTRAVTILHAACQRLFTDKYVSLVDYSIYYCRSKMDKIVNHLRGGESVSKFMIKDM